MRVGWRQVKSFGALWVLLPVVVAAVPLNSCQFLTRGQVLFARQGMQVGLQTDPSMTRSSPPAANEHPIEISPESMTLLLSAIRVSGWSGTILGYFETPPRIPLFDDAELSFVAAPIAESFRQATPAQRVFFYLPNPKSPYGASTAGFLFVRNGYLHLVVTDHKVFARADTGGADEKDPRDMKGMQLWVMPPYRKADVPSSLEPDWAPFETVHMSLNMGEVMARRAPVTGDVRSGNVPTARATEPASATAAAGLNASEASAAVSRDLQLQIRELTQSNLDLRDRLSQQTEQLKELKDEIGRLRRELDRAKAKTPPTKKPASP